MLSGGWANNNFDRTLNWRDIDWVRSLWPGKLVLKGILDVEDAKLAARPASTASWSPTTAAASSTARARRSRRCRRSPSAVGDRIEVLFDGGIRSGQDVLKALARGARGCMIGRAFLYGLAAGGEAGVRQALDLIRAELEVTHGAHRHARRARGDARRDRIAARRADLAAVHNAVASRSQ